MSIKYDKQRRHWAYSQEGHIECLEDGHRDLRSALCTSWIVCWRTLKGFLTNLHCLTRNSKHESLWRGNRHPPELPSCNMDTLSSAVSLPLSKRYQQSMSPVQQLTVLRQQCIDIVNAWIDAKRQPHYCCVPTHTTTTSCFLCKFPSLQFGKGSN